MITSLETLNIRQEDGVLFAEIASPPMNLLGPELVRDLVSLIKEAEADDGVQVIVIKSADPDYFISRVDLKQIAEYRAEAAKLIGEASIALVTGRVNAIALAPTEDFRQDSDLFGEYVNTPEAQALIAAAMKRGLQTRDAELAFDHVLGE
jgi:hypothetical protein